MGGGGWRGVQGAWTMEQEMRGRVSEDKDFLSLSLAHSFMHVAAVPLSPGGETITLNVLSLSPPPL